MSHLLFVDDTLVFYKSFQDQIVHLCWLLMWFETCSRLKVNSEKSDLIPIGSVDWVEELVLELGCK